MVTIRMTLVVGFFLPIFLESTIMAFPWDKFGLYTVNSCPGNLLEWESASRRLNCTMQRKVFKNRYHCVATRDRTHLVEFCYPQIRGIFGKGQCVILDPPFTLDNYTCLHFNDGCPDTHYFTDQVYKYPNCLRIEPVLKCFISDESCMNRRRINTSQNEESTIQAFLAHNVTKQVQEKEYLVEILLPTSILLGMLFGIAIFAMIYWKRRQISRFVKKEDLGKSGENEGKLLLQSQHETEKSNVDKLNNTTFIQPCEEDNSEKGEGNIIPVQYECHQNDEKEGESLLKSQLETAKSNLDMLNNTNFTKEFDEDKSGEAVQFECQEHKENKEPSHSTSDRRKTKTMQSGIFYNTDSRERTDIYGLYMKEYEKSETTNEHENTDKKKDAQYLEDPRQLKKELKQKIDKCREVLKDFEKNYGLEFVKTRAYENVLSAVENQRFIIVKGNPGDGKTTIAKHILQEWKEMDPLEIYSIKEIEPVPMRSKIAIFIDNLFGERSVKENELLKFKSRESEIKALVTNDNSKNGNIFIATIRNDIFEECKERLRHSQLFNSSVIDISHEGNQINRQEFKQFVEKYGLQKVITDVENLDIETFGYSIGIPQCFRLLKNNLGSNNVHGLFEHPSIFLREEIDQRIKEGQPKTAVLIYILLCGGNISKHILENPYKDTVRKKKAMRIIGMKDDSLSQQQFHVSAECFKGLYLIQDEKTYRFSHSSVQESLFLYLYKYHPTDIISECDPSLLLSLTASSMSQDTVGSNAVEVEVEMFPELIKRITNLITENKVKSAFKYVSLLKLWTNNEFTENVKENDMCVYSMKNNVDEKGNSMLFYFSRVGNLKMVEVLFPNSPEEERYKSLNKACRYGHVKVVDFFLDEKVDYDLKTCFYAVQSGKKEMLFRLTENIDVNQTELTNYSRWQSLEGSLLHEICFFGQNHLIDPVIKRYPELLEVPNSQGGNALHFLAFAGQEDAFRMLIEKKSDPYSRSYHGSTILHYACQNGKIEMVKYICDNYPKLLSKSYDCFDGQTCLHFAAQSGNITLFEYLLEKGVTISCQNNVDSPIKMAYSFGQLQMCRHLVQNHPELDESLFNTVIEDLDFISLILEVETKRIIAGKNGKSFLHLFCLSGNSELCKYIIKNYPTQLEVIDNYGYTVLHDAAWKGSIEVFELLIDKGLEVESTTDGGETVLHQCCRNGKLNMCKFLVDNYPHLLDIKNYENENALPDASWGGNIDVFEFLIDKGLCINSATRYGKSMLHWSCRNAKIQITRYLVSNYPYLLGAIDNDGMNVLHDAAWGGDTDLFEFLIEKNMDANIKANNGKTVLHWCCRNGNLLMWRYLITMYPHFLHLTDDDDENVLHDVAWGGNVNLFKYVMKKGFDVDCKTKKGKTVLHQSCRNGKLAMCKYLVQIHPELVKCIDNDGGNLLHDAAWGGEVEVFRFVLEKGLDVNSKTKKGKTVLHQSCTNGKVHMCKYLINHYQDLLEHIDNDGESVLHDAAFGGNIYLFDFLIDKGLDVNRKTNKGKTVLHKCCINGKVQMCKYLANHQPQLLTVQDNDGFNALHDAAIGGEVELCKFLLEKGLDFHSKTGTGQTVLHLCCHVGKHMGSHVDKQAIFDYLIDSYKDLLDVVDSEGNTVLHVACVQNQTKICSSLVEKFPGLLDIENKNGEKVAVCLVDGEKQFKMTNEH